MSTPANSLKSDTHDRSAADDAIDSRADGRASDFDALPTLYRDRSFWAMTVTQFLGAFNDNVYKQILLLMTVAVTLGASGHATDFQWLANLLFSVPFVLFSGIAGFWSDRTRKRSIIVACKVLEIVVMAGGAVAFYFLPAGGIPWGPLAVLFFMGTQSALFGPAKYGILPEMVRAADLPRFNGIIQMTTFIALILGIPLAGALKFRLGNEHLWVAGLVCVGISVVGTLASLGVRRTPVADQGARFTWSAVAVSGETWRMLRQSRAIGVALLVYSLFWFVAAVVPMATNATGVRQMGLNDEKTSLMLACVAVGIAVGCPLAGWLSRGRVNFGLVRIGAWGICVCLSLMSVAPLIPQPSLAYVACQLILAAAGVFVGLLAVPLQVFLQTSPPDEQKGRTIGTMNLINWIGIIVSGGYYFISDRATAALGWPPSSIFAMTAVLLLPVAVLYRPRNEPRSNS